MQKINGNDVSELQIGIAAEYMVCADLILHGYNAGMTTAGMPYDVILDDGHRLYRVQVKCCVTHRLIKKSPENNPFYIFNIGKNGKGGRRKKYDTNEVDIFAIVAIDTKEIGYLTSKQIRSCINFRVTKHRGLYKNELETAKKIKAKELKISGYTYKEISQKLDIHMATVRHYLHPTGAAKFNGKAGRYITDHKITDILK